MQTDILDVDEFRLLYCLTEDSVIATGLPHNRKKDRTCFTCLACSNEAAEEHYRCVLSVERKLSVQLRGSPEGREELIVNGIAKAWITFVLFFGWLARVAGLLLWKEPKHGKIKPWKIFAARMGLMWQSLRSPT